MPGSWPSLLLGQLAGPFSCWHRRWGESHPWTLRELLSNQWDQSLLWNGTSQRSTSFQRLMGGVWERVLSLQGPKYKVHFSSDVRKQTPSKMLAKTVHVSLLQCIRQMEEPASFWRTKIHNSLFTFVNLCVRV